MDIKELIKQLNDMMLLYDNRIILTIKDSQNEYEIQSITGLPCAKYFSPSDRVAEVIITIKPDI